LRRRDDLKMRQIVVFVDGRRGTAGILEFADELAQEHGAHLTVVFMHRAGIFGGVTRTVRREAGLLVLMSR
jgi:hypothetical protein